MRLRGRRRGSRSHCAPVANLLDEGRILEISSQGIVGCHLVDIGSETECLEHGEVGRDGHRAFALLDPAQGEFGETGPLGHLLPRDPSPAAGEGDAISQAGQGLLDRRKEMGDAS